MTTQKRPFGLLALIGPGILVAATGVGAGDLATAGFAGGKLGLAVLWAVAVGAFLKFVLNEGLTRWQLATGTTLLEGAVDRFGRVVAWVFLPYLLVWSFLVALALMSACGATMHAILPIFDEVTAKIVFGIAHSILGLVLVWIGGFKLFEKVMSVCIAVMFFTVVVTALRLWPGTWEVFEGLVSPDYPDAPTPEEGRAQLDWTVALMGGVGGTLTILCYGYWIREQGRSGSGALSTCRIDLGIAYGMTAIFGVAMVIICSRVQVEGTGVGLIVDVADKLGEEVGVLGFLAKWLFLAGAWGAVFSSLFGVWQAVPYLFTDFVGLVRRRASGPGVEGTAIAVDTKSLAYRSYLIGIALVPIVGLFTIDFKDVQKFYAIVGAFSIPMIGLALLFLNGRASWVGARHRNRWWTAVILVAALAFFSWFLWMKIAAFVKFLSAG